MTIYWLLPQLRDGAGVCSVCFLALRNVTFGTLPRNAGLASDNCAIRWGVIDAKTDQPAVWVQSRLTGSRFASFVTGPGFSGFHPLAAISDGLVLPVGSFDSAYLTQGSHYTWHYHGRTPLNV